MCVCVWGGEGSKQFLHKHVCGSMTEVVAVMNKLPLSIANNMRPH